MKSSFRWPGGAGCAVSLTYDDGLECHRTVVRRCLNRAGLRGTFYPSVRAPDFMGHPRQWAAMAAEGHEIGNHTVFHPCRSEPGHEMPWVTHYNLCDYALERYEQELRVANLTLSLLDSRVERSFATPCCDTFVGRGRSRKSVRPLLAGMFPAVRIEVTDRVVDPRTVNLADIDMINAERMTCSRMVEFAEQALDSGGWAVFTYHRVGRGEHSMWTDPREHSRFARWLSRNRRRVWTAPLLDVAGHIRRVRGR